MIPSICIQIYHVLLNPLVSNYSGRYCNRCLCIAFRFNVHDGQDGVHLLDDGTLAMVESRGTKVLDTR